MKKRRICSIFSVLAVCLTLNACMATKEKPTTKPEFKVPGKFQSDVPKKYINNTTQAPGPAVQSGWLKTFADPKLDKLVDEVIEKNFDLQIAAAKVDQAIASARIAGADLRPAVNLGLDSGLSKDMSTVGASLDVSWELDVWGRIRAGHDAATDELVATKLDYAFAKMSLAAQTAKAYFLAIETERQLQLSENNVANYSKNLEVVNAFFEEGMVSIQDVHLAKSEKAREEDALGSDKSEHLEALRSLEALLGRYPSAKVEIADTLPALPEPAPVGIPSAVLERRPDIVSAERRVSSAFNNTTAAKAAKLPRISLTGNLGTASNSLSNMASLSNVMWNVASNLLFPIFDGGKLDAQIEIASADQKQALAAYQKAALGAFVDIETALTNETIFRERAKSLKVAFEQAKLAEEIGLENYKAGEGNLQDVLQLQRATISSQKALSKIEQALLAQRVNLYLGLGGDFKKTKLVHGKNF
ncbi:MAG: efflux transporter outer membrane subunit [Caldithrix sp.]|nr:MAG: efflux transporter outer membrane subunit [Caldithrix sp.]